MHLCAAPLRRECQERAGLFVLQFDPPAWTLVLNGATGRAE